MRASTRFNPHPAWWPGATRRRPASARRRWPSFNPHPAWWPGATKGRVADRRRVCVSILTRRGGRVRRDGAHRGQRRGDVSILTRRGGRVRPCVRRLLRASQWCFNPHPAWWPGATRTAWRAPLLGQRRFNPHPAWWPGATDAHTSLLTSGECFNPHPAWWPGATSTWGPRIRPTRGFNPHPAWWPGATATMVVKVAVDVVFQSSPGVVAGCDGRHLDVGQQHRAVSILTRRGGRVRLAPASGRCRGATRFNPHPAWWPGATW